MAPSSKSQAKCNDTEQGTHVSKEQAMAENQLPIDRGWAWVIVIAVFFIYGMHGASSKVEGIVLVEMMEHFSSSQQVTLWVFSLGGLMMHCAGPVSSVIINKTNHRIGFFVGIGAMALGIALTSLMPRMEASFFSWTIIYGFGRGCIIVTAVTSTPPYFRKYLGLAMGISTAGSGLLSLVLPLALRFLFDNTTYEGALLLYGGIVAQLLVLAALVRPIAYYERRGGRKKFQTISPDVVFASLDGFVENKAECTDIQATASYGEVAAMSASKRDSSVDPWLKRATADEVDYFNQFDCHENGAVLTATDKAREAHKDDQQHRLAETASDLTPPPPPTPAQKHGNLGVLGLLRSGPFMALAAALMFYANAITIAYTSMAAYARNVGVDKETVAALLAASGAVEVLSRALHGWLSDRRILPSLVHVALCQATTGAAAALCPVLGGAVGVGVLSAACGMVGTAVYTIGPIALRELIGSENLTMALGVQLASRGASYVLSTVVIGLLVGATGSWDFVFYYIAGNAAAGALVTFAIYAWKRRQAGLPA